MAFSPDGHTLASGSDDATVRLWNLTDPAHPGPLGQPLEGHTVAVISVAFSPDGHTLASGSADHSVRLWNLTDPAHPGPLGQPLTGHTSFVVSVAFSPDGHTLASGSWDHSVRLWDLTDPAHPGPLGQPLTGHTATVWSVAFSPDGHTLASGSARHHRAVVARPPRRHRGDPLLETDLQHQPPRVARLDLTHHRLHHPLPQSACPTELNHTGLPRDSGWGRVRSGRRPRRRPATKTSCRPARR